MSADWQYSWWKDALDGKPVDSEVGNPRSGFWKAPKDEPVAIWRDPDGTLCCERTLFDGSLMKPDQIDELFSSASRYPIDEATYRAACTGKPPVGYATRLTLKEIQAGVVWSLDLGRKKLGGDITPAASEQVEKTDTPLADAPENPRAVIGDNRPPEPTAAAGEALGALAEPSDEIGRARVAYRDVSAFMADHPVIGSEDDARKAKSFIDRGKGALADLEAAQKRESKPLHDAWKTCLAKFKPASENLSKLVEELCKRQTVFVSAEEGRRVAEAAEKRRAADHAAEIARQAEQNRSDANENASVGEVGVDAGAAIENAAVKASEAAKAARQADLAERDSRVRIGGGTGRVQTLRQVEVLHVSDAARALECLGLTDKIKDAILSSARDYRKEHKRLPAGVMSFLESKIA